MIKNSARTESVTVSLILAADMDLTMRRMTLQRHPRPWRAEQLQAARFSMIRTQLQRRRITVPTAALKLRPSKSNSKGSADGETAPPSRHAKMRKAAAQTPAGTTKRRPGITKQAARQKQQEQQHAADDSSTGRWYSLVTGFPFPASSGRLQCCCIQAMHVARCTDASGNSARLQPDAESVMGAAAAGTLLHPENHSDRGAQQAWEQMHVHARCQGLCAGACGLPALILLHQSPGVASEPQSGCRLLIYTSTSCRASTLQVVKGQVWCFQQPQNLAGSNVHTNVRMTAVKLRSGGLLIYAPIAATR